jgi:hypothetical protein
MYTLRSYLDPDQQRTIGATSFMTERNEHEVRCGVCSRIAYVDEKTYHSISQARKSGWENPFKCEVCEKEYDDLAYES